MDLSRGFVQRTGLCAGWEIEFHLPEPLMIEIQMYKNIFKCSIDIRLPEPKPNSEQMLIVIPSAQLAQNPMLPAVILLLVWVKTIYSSIIFNT